MSASDEILVFGATGRQGGAVARELLRRGHAVRALVRDTGSDAAQALAGAGASLVTGDMDDASSLDAAMRGVSRVYSVQTFTGPDGVEGEERQGKAVADAAVRTGVTHLVYGSVGGADRGSGVPHFESKGRIEQYLEKLDLPVSVLQPAMFTSNFTMIGPARTDDGLVLSLALNPDTALQMITVEDIGFFAADAFENPDRYLGRRTEIAGEALTGPQMAEVFARIAGENVTFRQQPLEELRSFSEEAAIMFGWFNREGYRADIPALRAVHPGLTTLESWARENWSAPAA
ncbi:NmrA/HSCARG family protein [Streptomyces sp. NPDC057456]|uniref:NmrA/HSCARG family protein n=1 Tax=Streptomyces sp. NPDC057456 TaxID=3346139 RepID=UPI0036C956EA